MKSNILKLLLRLLTIVIITCLCFWLAFIEANYLRLFYALALLTGLIVEMILHVSKLYRDYDRFLISLLQDDFTTVFRLKGKTKDERSFYQTLNRITERFKILSQRKEQEHRFLQLLLEQIQTGILVINSKGQFVRQNQAFQYLTGFNSLHSIEGILQRDPAFAKALNEMYPGEAKVIRPLNKSYHLHTRFVMSRSDNEEIKLYTFHDIKNELERTETEAWEKLIRVLTHEIMNSVTPVNSLSSTLALISESDPKVPETLKQGLKAIEKRSAGLIDFTKRFKKVSRLPDAVFSEIDLRDWLLSLKVILKSIYGNKEGILEILTSDNPILVSIDPLLMEQVLINLVKNGFEAAIESERNPEVIISLSCLKESVNITVRDNGNGFSEEARDKAFVPFYSTKQFGSGIGLGVVRQIIWKHGGIIKISSIAGEGALITIELPRRAS